MIDDFRLWGSRRWSRGGVRPTNVGPDTRAGHDFNYHNASLSEGVVLPVVVERFSETPHCKRSNTDVPRPLRPTEARPRLAGPPPARRGGAPHGRGAGGGSDPRLFAADAPREGARPDRPPDTFSPRSGVAPTTVIPGGKAIDRCSGLRRSTRAGQVAGPLIHEPALALEQVRARVGCLDRVAAHMRQGRLNDFTPMVRLQPFGNTGHGPVHRRREDESEQKTGPPNDAGMIDDFRLAGPRMWRRKGGPFAQGGWAT